MSPRYPEIEIDLNDAPVDEVGRTQYVVHKLEEAGVDAAPFLEAATGLYPTKLLELMASWVTIK